MGDLDRVVDSAHRVAGAVAARGRGDLDGARTLLTGMETQEDLVGGALLTAELALGLLAEGTGRSLDACVGDLNLRLMGLGRLDAD